LASDFDLYEKLFEGLDAKSEALLTLISIMIAATVFSFSEGDESVAVKAAFMVILAFFLLTVIALI